MADANFPKTHENGILSGVTPRAWTPESSWLNTFMSSRDIQDIGLAGFDRGGTEAMPLPQSLTGSYVEENQESNPTAFTQDGRVYIRGPGGHVEERSGGTRAWRNNNPGNIEGSNFANTHGAIGGDGRFAIFPSQEADIARLSRCWDPQVIKA